MAAILLRKHSGMCEKEILSVASKLIFFINLNLFDISANHFKEYLNIDVNVFELFWAAVYRTIDHIRST